MDDNEFMLAKCRRTIVEIEHFLFAANRAMANPFFPIVDLENLRVRLHWLKRCERVLVNSMEKP